MTDKVIETIKKFHMLELGDKVTAALSGGADSVCLLLMLLELKDIFKLDIDAIHINHMIRGAESDGDEEFCRRLCKKLNVNFTAKRIDVPAYADKTGQSLEEAARDIRYDQFKKHTQSLGKLATAHTASDNAETVIFNMARGSGIKGLCGIPPVRDNIIRPLIFITRSEIEAFLQNHEQDFVTDSTNLSDDYSRNRIRHKIIPEILKINSGFYKTISANTQLLNEENNFLQKMADKAYSDCKVSEHKFSDLSKYDSVIRKRCIMKILKEENLPCSMDKVNSADNIILNGGKINMAKNVYITSKQGILSIECTVKSNNTLREIKVGAGEYKLFDNKICVIEIMDYNAFVQPNVIFMDYDKIIGCTVLRGRKYGDKINLIGRNFTSSVKKILNEKIPEENRAFIHFIADEGGLIFMEDVGIAQRVKTDEHTKKILTVKIKDVI